ncbi:MAG: 4Fe-4S cluster-binding domain-containing protein [Luteolibacter sp.]
MSLLLRYACHTVGALEVPDEISLVYSITGCPLQCPGCHSADLRNPRFGEILDPASFTATLTRYRGLATCVCFLGGEWQPEPLVELLHIARAHGFSTCLYTGRNEIEDILAVHLDYLKLGPFIASRGGLDHPSTNQRFLDLRTGKDITHRFRNSPSATAIHDLAA